MGITVWIGGVVVHSIFPMLMSLPTTICGVIGDIAPKISILSSMSSGTVRFPIHPCNTREGIMAKVKKSCQHIHGRAFVVNEINDLPGIEGDLFISSSENFWINF